MFIWIIALIVFYFIEDLIAYKIIRRIDKKERKRINSMEEKHVQYMLDNEELTK